MNRKAISIIGGPSANNASRGSQPITEKIKILDFLAPDVGLNYRGASGVKTYCGVLLSILSASVFLAASVYIGLRYLDTTQPAVLQDVSTVLEYPEVDLIAERRITAIIFFNNSVPITPNLVPLFVTAHSILKTQEAVQSGGKISLQNTLVSRPLIPCKNVAPEILKLLSIGDESQAQYLMNYALCPEYNLQDFKVVGKASDILSKSFEIIIYPCSLGPDKCVSQETVSKFAFTYAHIEPSFNMSNCDHPISYAWNPNDYYHVNIGAVQITSNQLVKTEVWNDGGLFSSVKLVSSAYSQGYQSTVSKYRDPTSVQCATVPVTEANCTPYLIFQNFSGPKTEKLTRSYKGAIETIGEIGGIRDIIFTAAIAIYWLFHSKLTCKEVVSQVYDIPMQQESHPEDGRVPDSKRFVQVTSLHGTNMPSVPAQMKTEMFEMGSTHNHRDTSSQVPLVRIQEPTQTQSNGSHIPVVEFDYHTAMQAIEDTLDVVTLVRRIQWLETFSEYVLQHTNAYNNVQGALLNSMSCYLIAKKRLEMASDNAQKSTQLKPGEKSNLNTFQELATPRNFSASEPESVGKALGDEYQEFLKQTVSTHVGVRQHTPVSSGGPISMPGTIKVEVPDIQTSQNRAKFYRNSKMGIVLPTKTVLAQGLQRLGINGPNQPKDSAREPAKG